MIPTEQIIESCLKDISIKANCSVVVGNATLQVSNQIAKDILHTIVTLYILVLSFSHAKDIVELFKCKTIKTSKSLLAKR